MSTKSQLTHIRLWTRLGHNVILHSHLSLHNYECNEQDDVLRKILDGRTICEVQNKMVEGHDQPK